MEMLRLISKLILFTFIIIGQPAGLVSAQDFRVEVVVDQLNVRPEPPKFTLKTLITFKYQVPPPSAVVRNHQILDVHEVKSVGNNAEWLRISVTTAEGVQIQGWVYAGRSGNWVNVRRMDNRQSFHIPKKNKTNKTESFLDSIIPVAYADDKEMAKSSGDIEGTEAASLYVLLVIIFNVALFLAAMFVAKKIYQDIKFIIFTGVSTLLIEGVVTEAGFWGWMENIL
ncbi:hypothetical protein ACFL9U_17845 [Thermodesulfobacteriota bacterium]